MDMNDNEILFVGMNIKKEVEKLIELFRERHTLINNGMGTDELAAYDLGVKNTLSALNSVLQTEEEQQIVVHIESIDAAEELDLEDLIEKVGLDI